jgi:cytochrome c peroxidase
MALAVGLGACAGGDEPVSLVTSQGGIRVPEGFPDPYIPADNPATPDKIELGRHLFYDERLSGNETQACASCHLQELAFTDGVAVAEGSTGQLHPRNSNGLTNVAYNSNLTWANPTLTELEVQILIPLFGDAPVELGANDDVLDRLAADAEMVERFDTVFPDEGITWDTVVAALATFNRALISGDSRFDQFAYGNDPDALSAAELRGMELFYSETLECHHCHGGFNFSEATTHADSVFDAALFHNTGLYNLDGEGAYPNNNPGVFDITGDPQDMGRFRPPSLRNVERTAPYMHDGSIETLEEVLDHYARGGRLIEDGPYAGDGAESPLKSGLVAGFDLSDAERSDLIAFLRSLTDDRFLTDPALSAPTP